MNDFQPTHHFRVFPALGEDKAKGIVVEAMDAVHARKVFREQTGRAAGVRSPIRVDSRGRKISR